MRIAGTKACRGFSVAELIISILVISIILAAFTPLITQKARNSLTVKTNVTKGLQIYTNPGTYAFDVPIGIDTIYIQGAGGGGGGGGATTSDEIKFATVANTTWTVPKGVNQIKLKITGSGGGGGSGCGNPTNKVCKSYDWDKWNSGASVKRIPEYMVVRGADDGGDLCVFTQSIHGGYPNWMAIKDFTVDTDTTCDTDYCCWRTTNPPEKGTAVCTYPAALSLCEYYPNPNSMEGKTDNPERNTYRLPSQKELEYIATNIIDLYTVINICGNNDNSYCPGHAISYPANRYCDLVNAKGTNEGRLSGIWGNNWYLYRAYHFDCNSYVMQNTLKNAYQARCVRPIKHYTPYGGAGGSSGSIMEKNINVLPGDTFTITIGRGGNAGVYGTNVDFGRGTRSGNGARGGDTKVVHKRNNIELGTYYVKGGLGGWAATYDRTGAALTDEQANPSDMCHIKSRETTSGAFSEGNVTCNIRSYPGAVGTTITGGDGGKVNNTGTITQGKASSGGYIYDDPNRAFGARNTATEATRAEGRDANEYGFGGGGGLAPTWANSTSHFFKGGKGGDGKVEITYKISLPGSGGGAGSRVGGAESANNKGYEIKYKVNEGDRIVFKIGTGGTGGLKGENGTNGSPTIIGNNTIVFLGGEGGKTSTQEQRNNLGTCVQNASSQTDVLNCINNSTYKPQGGQSGVINSNGEIEVNTLGLLIGNTTDITYSVLNNSYKGQNGNPPAQMNINTAPWKYGLDGGTGGAPFGVKSSNATSAVTCGGGITGTYGTLTDVTSYICTSGNINGNEGIAHDPVNNEYGGSGGGGGGFIENSSQEGKGGNGSSGYLRVRWDVTQQH